MATNGLPLQQPDLGDAYQALYDALGKMYWEASTVDTKDQVHGVMEEVGALIDQLDSGDLASNTSQMIALQSRMTAANKDLQKIQDDVKQITKNISTAANVVAAIAKVVSLVPKV